MRISDESLQCVKTAFRLHFGQDDHLWLFGSRVDDSKRGGDYDFYIESNQDLDTAAKSETAFVIDLWDGMGEQKIDVVLKLPDSKELPIHRLAKARGIQLI